MSTARATGDSPWNDEFLALVCNDPELLRAEFDAIIASARADPPTDPSPSTTGGGHSRRASRPEAETPDRAPGHDPPG